MKGSILVVNAGSSSLKFAIFDVKANALLERAAYGEIDRIGIAPHVVARDQTGSTVEDLDITPSSDGDTGHRRALEWLIDWLGETTRATLLAVGHRVVHGGGQFTKPIRITGDVVEQLERLAPLAPLHQLHNLSSVRAITCLRPGVLQVACFDTAFHTTQPWVAQTFALPRGIRLTDVKRYGFHGLSYEFVASVLPQFLSGGADGKVVVAHLGNGASLCAMRQRRSIATTMGFTALDGLMMGTRCGSLDPGVLLYLLAEKGMSLKEVERMLYHESGLLGVSDISSDMRVLESSNQPTAQAAIELFVYRICRELGSLVAALGGLDALVFTAGIGENSAMIRRRVCHEAAWLGIEIDENANRGSQLRLSTQRSRVSIWIIPTNEELMIAQHTLALLKQ